jgi:hypothetical protein
MEIFRERIKIAVGVLLLIVGLASLVFIVVNLAQDLPIWLLGRRVDAQVVELWVERVGEIGNEDYQEVTFDYFIRYQFATPAGETFTRVVKTSVSEWATLEEGGRVAVIYLPFRPAHSRLDDRRFLLFFIAAYVPFALVVWLCLTYGWSLVQPLTIRVKNREGG